MAEFTTWRQVVVFVFVVIALSETTAKDDKLQVGSYFTRCRRSDPKMQDCVRDNIEKMRKNFSTGVPDLRLNSLDPMNIPQIGWVEGRGGLELRQTATNVTIKGLVNFQLKDIEYKADNNNIYFKMVIFVPSLFISSNYVIKGRILVLPITGSGLSQTNITGVTIELTCSGNNVERRGEKYHDITSTVNHISVKGLTSYLDGLYNGDKFLGDATNRFLNANWEEAFKVYKHLPEQAFGSVFQEYVNLIYKKFPIKDLYLD